MCIKSREVFLFFMFLMVKNIIVFNNNSSKNVEQQTGNNISRHINYKSRIDRRPETISSIENQMV